MRYLILGLFLVALVVSPVGRAAVADDPDALPPARVVAPPNPTADTPNAGTAPVPSGPPRPVEPLPARTLPNPYPDAWKLEPAPKVVRMMPRATPAPVPSTPASYTSPRRRLQRANPFAVTRGPVEWRDQFITAQVRMTLPAVSPDPLGCGRWYARLSLDWGNDFGFKYTQPELRRGFMVDGEHRTLETVLRYGLTSTIDVGVRVPVCWRGGGMLDGFIDFWHSVTGTLGNDREEVDRDRYVVEGTDESGTLQSWTEERGTGLGNMEIEARWAFLRPRGPCGWRAAVVGRVGLPTATDPFRTDSVDLGLQAAFAKRLGRRWDVYGGIGGTWFSEPFVDGFEYAPVRGHAFAAVEFRAGPGWSLVVQTDLSTELITNLDGYQPEQWYILTAAKMDVSPNWSFVVGFVENLVSQQVTTDFGIILGTEIRF